MREKISRSLQKAEQLLEDAPDMGGLKQLTLEEVRLEIKHMRTLLADSRPPRFAIVGRRGAGKSTLINAIFGEYIAEVGHEKATTGEPKWWTYEGERGELEILDTRGFQEGSQPDQRHDEGVDAQESIVREVSREVPDAILFLVKAKEVDAAIDRDLEMLENVSQKIEDKYGTPPPVVGILTQCDEVEPPYVQLHKQEAFSDEEFAEKTERIAKMEGILENKIRQTTDLGDQLVEVLGVCAYMSWASDGSVRADRRWQIGSLVQYLVDELPDEAQFELARLSRVKFVQNKVADRISHGVSVIAAGIGAAPTPVADIAPISSLQLSLVTIIGFLSGRELKLGTATEFLGALGVNAGAAFAAREVARALSQLIPVAGSAISGAVAYGTTFGIGKAAQAYFLQDAEKDEAAEVFEQYKKQGKAKFKEKEV